MPSSPIPSQGALTSASWVTLVKLLETDPSNLRLRAELFERALAAGALDVAASALDGVLAIDPSGAEWRHRKAVLSMARGDWQGAETQLQGLINEGQHDPGVRYNLAYTHFALGQSALAHDLLVELMQEQPADLMDQVLTLRLRCLHQEHKLQEGVALYQQFEAQHASASAAGAAALIAVDLGQPALADAWASRALAMNPQQHEALVAKGSVLLGKRQGVQALPLLLRAEQEHPRDGRTLSALGLAYMLNGNFAEALAVLHRAVQFMPNHIGTWHAIGWCAIFLRDLAAAQVAFERAISLDRNFAESQGGLAVTFALRGQSQLARETLRRAEGLPGRSVSAEYASAILGGEAQDVERFEKMARRILGGHHDAEGRSLADLILRR